MIRTVKIASVCALGCAALLFLFAAWADEVQFAAAVVHVGDGDGLVVQTADRQKITLRLFGIDCPELRQPYGNKAKQYTSAVALGKPASVKVHGMDDRGRALATVIVAGRNLNEELVALGLAWAYTHYSARYVTQERQARTRGIGLWSAPNPTAPWEFRNVRSGRQNKAATKARDNVVYVTMNGKKYHRQGCNSLIAKASAISVRNAQIRGYTPCGTCKP